MKKQTIRHGEQNRAQLNNTKLNGARREGEGARSETATSFAADFRHVLAMMALAIACAFAANSAAAALPAYALQTGSIGAYYSNGYVVGSSFTASPSSVTLKEYSDTATVKIAGCSSYPRVTSSDSSVAVAYSVSRDYSQSGAYNVVVKKKGVGTAVLAIGDSYGNVRRVNVTCNPSAFRLNYGNYTFGKATSWRSHLYIHTPYDEVGGHASDSRIVKVKNSKKSVVSAKLHTVGNGSYVEVTPKKAGTAKLTVTDQYGNKKVVKVKVAKNFFKHNLKTITDGYTYYGEKTMSIYTAPKAKVTVKIGKERHSAKADKYGHATIKLKKVRKVGTKFSITAKTSKAKITKRDKVRNGLEYATSGTVWSCKRYFPVTARNLHKGDTVSVSAGGETYSYKVSADMSYSYHTFWFRYTMRCYRVVNIKITNKFGQAMYTHTRYLNWR